MATLSTLIPRVANYIPDVPDMAIEEALNRAAHRFFVESMVWREVLENPSVFDGAYVLDLDLPSGSQLVSLIQCTRNGDALDLAGSEIMFTPEPDHKPEKVYAEGAELIFDGRLASGDVVNVMCCLTTSRTSPQFPDRFLDEYGPAFVNGAVGELYRYPTSQLRNFELAVTYEALFANEMVMAKGRASSGRTHAKRTVKYGGL